MQAISLQSGSNGNSIYVEANGVRLLAERYLASEHLTTHKCVWRNKMSDKLVETKLVLARKYDRLAKAASSKVNRATFSHKAERYRRQVKELSRG